MNIKIEDKRTKLLQTQTNLILECLSHYSDEHPELLPIIKKLSSGNYVLDNDENYLLFKTTSSYCKISHGSKKNSLMYIAVCFDPYAQELQSRINNLKKDLK